MYKSICETNIVKNLETVHKGEEVVIAFFKENYPCKFGIFDDYAVAEKVVSNLDGKGNWFMSLNHFGSDFKADFQRNVLFSTREFGDSLKNVDVDKYNYFFVDIDPERYTENQGKCSATDKEVESAYSLALNIKEFLSKEMDFAEPIMAFSGNGYHLLYKVDIEANEQNIALFKKCLKVLAKKFNTDDACVDEKIFNPARNTKLYGVLACKGVETEERPHRRSGIIFAPSEESVTSLEKIRILSEYAVIESKNKKGRSSDDNDNNDKKEKLDEFIGGILKHAVLFQGKSDGSNYITIYNEENFGGCPKTYKINDKRLKALLLANYHKRTNIYIQTNALDKYIDTFNALAANSGKVDDVWTRIGRVGDVIYYDLKDEENIVKISKEGVEILSHFASIDEVPKFIRKSVSAKQVMPKKQDNASLEGLLKPYLNLSNEQMTLLLITLIAWFIPDSPKVILLLTGQQGSGKTVLAKIIQRIVDPVNHEAVFMPKGTKNIGVVIASHYVVSFDNLSEITGEVSDLLCQVSTGGSIMNRQLYTDGEASILSFKNCLILNGINDIAAKPDLLDRIVHFELKNLEKKRLTEERFWNAFQKDLPAILYEIFDILHKAIKEYSNITLEYPGRMADYETWGCAISKVIKGDEKYFLEAYKENRLSINANIIEDNDLCSLILDFIKKSKKEKLIFSPTAFYSELKSQARKNDISATNSKIFPESPAALTKKLEPFIPDLKKAGIEINRSRSGNRGRLIIIKNLVYNTEKDKQQAQRERISKLIGDTDE